MKILKWSSALLAAILCFGCVTPKLQREVKLIINSEPPDAKVYEDGKLLGQTPLNLTYRYEVQNLQIGFPIYGDSNGTIQALLQPRSFTAMKEGFASQTRSFHFPQPTDKEYSVGKYTYLKVIDWRGESEYFNPRSYSLLFALESQDAKPQQQQQQQQQQTTIVMPAAGGAAKTFGSLTILSTPTQAEVYIDGTFVATTPASNLQIEAGPHKIEIQKSGYKTWARTMQVLVNTPVKIEVELEKI